MKTNPIEANFFETYKANLLALLLCISIIALLGIPYTNWGFKTDDFGNIFHCKINQLNDVWRWFYEGSIEAFNHASNYKLPEQAFFCGLYRPVSFIYYYLQYLLFGPHAYGYFLVTVIIHALNAALLFLLFLNFTSYTPAFLGAALFAFQPSLWNWLGWISAQTYQTELLVLLLIIFALKKYLHSKQIVFYFTACFLFALNLFLKEATIFLPAWVIAACLLYLSRKTPAQNLFTNIKQSIVLSLGFWTVSIGYVIARAAIFPLTSNTATLTFEPTWASFIARQKTRLFDFVTYVSDMMGLAWLPQNNQLLKGLIITSIFTLLLWLFIKNSQKVLILFLAWSTLLFSWPALLMHYQPRYIYLAIPFFILMVLCLLQFHKKSTDCCFTLFKNGLGLLASLCLAYNACFLMHKLTLREKALYKVNAAFTELIAQNPEVRYKPLYFIGLPETWFGMGTAQAIWLLIGSDKYPVYQYGIEPQLAGKPSYLDTQAFGEEVVQIESVPQGFLFKSLDKNKIWFLDEKRQKVTSIVHVIDPLYQTKNPIYISWDYNRGQFIILNHESAA